MTQRFSPAVEALLREAGWTQGRQVSLQPWLSRAMKLFPEAQRVLTEFGGLKIGRYGEGIEVAKTDVDLRPNWTDPNFAGYPQFEAKLGQRLYTLGRVAQGNGYLLIDESGRIFHLLNDLMYAGPTFESALEAFLLGRRVAP